MSCVSSGGASARQRRAASTIDRPIGSAIAWRTSSSSTFTSTVLPLDELAPDDERGLAACELGNAEPIAILISSAAVSPIATP